jgi:hypothetical protein
LFKKLCVCAVLGVLAAGGCSLGPVKTYNGRALPSTLKLGGADPVFVSTQDQNGVQTIPTTAKEFRIESPSVTTLKYMALPFAVGSMPGVKVRLPNGRTYDAYVDTGFSEYVWANDLVVQDNNLPTYPIGTSDFTSAEAGIAYLPWMELGRALFINPPCRYQQLHWELQLLGIPLWRQKSLLIGVKALSQFNYVVFDNEHYQMQLASRGRFEPTEPERWRGYELTTEPDSMNNMRFFVEMPIAGRYRKIMFDTCGGYGLIVHPAVWRQIARDFGDYKLSNGKFISGFQGFLPCKKGNIPQLAIAGRTINNAQVIVPDESTSYLGSVEAVASLAYFKDTAVVLDNVRHLLWVKN